MPMNFKNVSRKKAMTPHTMAIRFMGEAGGHFCDHVTGL